VRSSFEFESSHRAGAWVASWSVFPRDMCCMRAREGKEGCKGYAGEKGGWAVRDRGIYYALLLCDTTYLLPE